MINGIEQTNLGVTFLRCNNKFISRKKPLHRLSLRFKYIKITEISRHDNNNLLIIILFSIENSISYELSNFILIITMTSQAHTLLPLLVACLAVPIVSIATSFDISQPTILTWTTSSASSVSTSTASTSSSSLLQSGNKESTLIVYNMQYQTTANMRKIATFPSGYYEENGKYYFSQDKATLYEPAIVQYQVMVNYYYDSGNGDSAAAEGVTMGTASLSANTVINQDVSSANANQNVNLRSAPSTTASSSSSGSSSSSSITPSQSSSSSTARSLLSAQPLINYKYMEYLHKLRMTQSNTIYIYEFQKSLYSFSNDITLCSQMADFSAVDIEAIAAILRGNGDSSCVSFTPEQLITRNMYVEKAVYAPTNQDDKGTTVVVQDQAIAGVTVNLDPIVVGGSQVQVRPLGQAKIDFSQIILSVKNIVSSSIQNLQITLTNQSPNPIFIKLELTLSDTILLSRSILIQPSTPRTLSTPLSKSSPSSSLAFKLTNPFTNQAYTLNTPVPLVTASDISYAFNGVNYQQVSSLSIGAIVGMSVGGLAVLVVAGVGVSIVRRRRNQVKKAVQEKVFDLRLHGVSIDRPNLTTSTTQRQFLQATIRNPFSTPVKQKPSTSTTLDSNTNTNTNEDRGSIISKQSISLDREQSQQKVPSIEDNMDYQQKFQEIRPSASSRRRFKGGHRRTSSAIQFLPSVSEEQHKLDEIERNRNGERLREETRRMMQERQLELERQRELQRLKERERQYYQQQQQQQQQQYGEDHERETGIRNLPQIIMLRRDESMETRETQMGLNDGVEQLDHVKV